MKSVVTPSRRPAGWPLGLCFAPILLLGAIAPTTAAAQPAPTDPRTSGIATRCVRLEFYAQPLLATSIAARDELDRFTRERPTIEYRLYSLDQDAASKQRLEQICRYFHVEVQTPLVYGCGRPVVGFQDAASFQQQLKDLTTITVYVRAGCPRCANAKAYLPRLQQRFPSFTLRLRDVVSDAQASREMQDLVQKHRTAAASLPVFHICDELLVGFDSPSTTGVRLEGILERWTRECPSPQQLRPATGSTPRLIPRYAATARAPIRLVSAGQAGQGDSSDDDSLPLPTDNQLPALESETPLPETTPSDGITLPYFGQLSVEQIGLPLFTLAVGLVDGFNPCAMWVLTFLLSILVNVRSRGRILAVAGSFVLVSGAAYFAFMAAWLNVFLFLGLLTWVRLTLASLAIVVGVIHVKDFFAFKRGITLSIPESAKPGIYDRVRRIVTAENLVGAVIGATVLAVLVNIIELLCTAGLPALYTQVLSAQQLPQWQNYAYLLLYNLAYMLDDSLMVGLVVLTLERHKLQEKHGRWLKLVSGLAILVLGGIMFLRPDWLGMSS